MILRVNKTSQRRIKPSLPVSVFYFPPLSAVFFALEVEGRRFVDGRCE